MNRSIKCTTFLLWLFLTTVLANAQPSNLLRNPSANDGTNHWRAFGEAAVEKTHEGGANFRVRNSGFIVQDVSLPEGSVDKYALLIGRVSSERINADRGITGLPYLYGFMMEGANPPSGRIWAYLQGQHMLCEATRENEWVTAWGIFRVPLGTGTIRFFMNQAERKNVPQNGSAARFDDLGLYLFDTQEEAAAFVNKYKDQKP